MNTAALPKTVENIRRFNRFYTKQLGLLSDSLLKSGFSLAEARVLYELAQHEQSTATELANELGLDLGYLSRILSSFNQRGLIEKRPGEEDRRQVILTLTGAGQDVFSTLNSRSRAQIESMIREVSSEELNRLLHAMQTIEELLGAHSEKKVTYLLRTHQPGDMGWVVHRHGILYAQEYGWDEQFEALVAEIVAQFIKNFDPTRERCWIAELDGENVGSVFLVKASETTAKLRLLLVDPKARGLGIGSRLVEECIGFARRAGYRKITLWTNSVLLAARHIYQKAGFRLLHAEAHHSFGHDLTGETWEISFRDAVPEEAGR